METQLNRAKVPNVILVGGTGCGKSTIALQLARFLGFGVKDVDADVVSRADASIAEIFSSQGREGFRALETEALQALDGIANHVVAIGAGALELPENLALVKTWGPLVWVRSPTQEVVHRLGMNPDELRSRPLLQDAVHLEDREQRFAFIHSKVSELLDERLPVYSQADISVLNSYATAEVSARVIKTELVRWSWDTELNNDL